MTQPTDRPGACIRGACTQQCTTECREAINRAWHSLRGQQPAEHCGHQPDHVIGQPTECVLRPGHSGSHANETGMRWWLAKLPDETTTDRPGIDDLTSDMLDQLYGDLDWAREQTLAAQQEATASATRLERTEAERDMLGRETDRLRKDWVEMRTRAEKAEATLTAVRELVTRANQAHAADDSDYGTGKYNLASRLLAVLDQHGQTTKELT
ncbi:hypothetical protein ACFWV1_13055 [Streptomyces sp. NPDC058700]|uniref:hypothetical protein n=1 Tax=Streptomyces sp. NPDC058700 TaxID=3346607 RepID=UPI003662CB92